MSQIDDGGPAFPNPIEWDPNGQMVFNGSLGMTLRDWFATHASDEDIAPFIGLSCNGSEIVSRTRQAAKYAYADAMLAARKRGAE